jgi:hypothetical protein
MLADELSLLYHITELGAFLHWSHWHPKKAQLLDRITVRLGRFFLLHTASLDPGLLTTRPYGIRAWKQDWYRQCKMQGLKFSILMITSF